MPSQRRNHRRESFPSQKRRVVKNDVDCFEMSVCQTILRNHFVQAECRYELHFRRGEEALRQRSMLSWSRAALHGPCCKAGVLIEAGR